jgi:hypothetical protein
LNLLRLVCSLYLIFHIFQGSEIMKQSEQKKILVYLMTFCFVFLFALNFNPAHGQQRPEEQVTVIAVEVPVRVLQKGQVVRNLTKEDFEIFANGLKQEITGFEIRLRKISKELSQAEMEAKQEKRLFLLIFNIFDYNDTVGEAIDHFFEQFFSPGDQLVILTENRIFNIERGKRVSEVASDLKDTLKRFKLISNQSTYNAYRDLRIEADRLLNALRGDARNLSLPWDRAILQFYENYQRVWGDYRRRYLTPDVELYRSLIKRVKQLEGEKWAICFQQRDLFPKLKNEGPLDLEIRNQIGAAVEPTEQVRARMVQAKQSELARMFDLSKNFPEEVLSDLFLEANITFHLILMKSQRTLLEKDFELREVAKDYENLFKEISTSTGGHSVFSNKVVEAMEEASQTEDYYYLLVYNPKADVLDKEIKIDVKVNQKGANVVHLKRFVKERALPVSIINFKSGRKSIKFSIVNYQRTEIEGKMTGIADVKVTLFDDASNKVYDEGNILSLVKDETTISIPFNQLKSGSYFIIIQVVDRITNEIDVYSGTIKL